MRAIQSEFHLYTHSLWAWLRLSGMGGLEIVDAGDELPHSTEVIPLQGWNRPVYWRPLLVALPGTAVALTCALAVAGWVQSWMDAATPRASIVGFEPIAAWLVLYTVAIIAARMSERGTDPAYELLWACNVSMLLAAAGMVLDLPVAVAGAVLAVSLDQLCWYVDTAGWAVSGKWGWPVGVSGYLNDPEQRTWVRYLTTWHHLWFMPLAMTALAGTGGFTPHALIVSGTLTAVLISWCRAFTTRWLALTLPGGKKLSIICKLCAVQVAGGPPNSHARAQIRT